MVDDRSWVAPGLRAEVLEALRDALGWRLTETRWRAVGSATAAMVAAVRAGDPNALRDAMFDLESAGPVRATRIGQPPTVPPPQPVLEEINELIHTVDGRGTSASE